MKPLCKPDILPMHIYIDKDEKRPYSFLALRRIVPAVTMSVAHLPEGDYSVRMLIVNTPDPKAAKTVLERKAFTDFLESVGTGHKLLADKLWRMRVYGYPALVIEASWDMIWNPNAHLPHPTKVNSRSAICSLIAWASRYRIGIWTTPTGTLEECRRAAEQITFRLLERWHLDRNCNSDILDRPTRRHNTITGVSLEKQNG